MFLHCFALHALHVSMPFLFLIWFCYHFIYYLFTFCSLFPSFLAFFACEHDYLIFMIFMIIRSLWFSFWFEFYFGCFDFWFLIFPFWFLFLNLMFEFWIFVLFLFFVILVYFWPYSIREFCYFYLFLFLFPFCM